MWRRVSTRSGSAPPGMVTLIVVGTLGFSRTRDRESRRDTVSHAKPERAPAAPCTASRLRLVANLQESADTGTGRNPRSTARSRFGDIGTTLRPLLAGLLQLPLLHAVYEPAEVAGSK